MHQKHPDKVSNLLRTPPSREAFRHSGEASLRCTSATVTLKVESEVVLCGRVVLWCGEL